MVLEVGPGLGSLTLALLEAAVGGGDARLVAVEIDPVLAAELPKTIADRAPEFAARVEVVTADALAVGQAEVGAPTVLAANLPYNVAVPVLLTLLAALPSLDRGIVMVQAEVADRMCAGPGSRVYGAPSAKLAWYAVRPARRAASRGPSSGRCRTSTPSWSPSPGTPPPETTASRAEVFAVDRRGLRPAPQDPAGGARAAGPGPRRRPSGCCGRPAWTRARAASRWPIDDFARIAKARHDHDDPASRIT